VGVVEPVFHSRSRDPLEPPEFRATTTSTGLTVSAVLDTTTYDCGIKITDKQIAALEASQAAPS
jgi:Rhodopirellula transposase.